VYSKIPALILGFHGCDRSVGEEVIRGNRALNRSTNSYDWLGEGIYFWENNPERALEFAVDLKKHPRKDRPTVTEPYVVGAVICLGYCMNLVEKRYLEILKSSYELLIESLHVEKKPIPENKPLKSGKDLLLRDLDCAVINAAVAYHQHDTGEIFDSVRGMFIEGEEIYEKAGFREKNHIQLCIRNPNYIKGYFAPLTPDSKYSVP
jgi:hypothetical protein